MLFNGVDIDKSGTITANELKRVYSNTNGLNFSDEACKMMISMFDADRSGKIDIYEFDKLYNDTNMWITIFRSFDRDNSGSLSANELLQVFTQMGLNLDAQVIQLVLSLCQSQSRNEMNLDQFIITSIKMQRLNNAFRMRDMSNQGIISVTFNDLVAIVFATTL